MKDCKKKEKKRGIKWINFRVTRPETRPYFSSTIFRGKTELFNCCTHFLQLPTLFAEMSNFLQNFLIHLCTRVLFSNNFIQSRLSYACQNWNLTQRQFDRCCLLCVFEKCGLRWLSFSKQNEWYSYVISNVWLHELYETSDLSSIIKC